MDKKIYDQLELTAEIVSAYVAKNPVPASDLPALIASVHQSLHGLASGSGVAAAKGPLIPAVPISKSVMPDYIVCLEDGKKYKSLKRTLKLTYGMSPEQYRAKWGLSQTYPMVAPNYSAKRSQMAKDLGLGRKPGQKVTVRRKGTASP